MIVLLTIGGVLLGAGIYFAVRFLWRKHMADKAAASVKREEGQP